MNIKYRIVILEEVFDEINEVALYYEEQQIGLGSVLLTEWEKALHHLSKTPEGYQKKYKSFR